MGKRSRTHRRYEKPHLLSLSGDILNDIGDRLDEQDLCNMELACRTLNSVLSTPSGTGLCGRVLDLRTGRLRALSPEASRGLQGRMFRYSNILSDFSDASMLEREVRLSSSRKTAGGVVQPLLPSMLAACAPAAELTLIVQATQGQEFLSMPHGSSAYAGPQLSTFWENLRQHLTELTLAVYHHQSRAPHLESLGMLTALQKLKFDGRPPPLGAGDGASVGQSPYCTLPGKKLALNLPHLTSLRLSGLKAGAIVLSCPELTDISLVDTQLLRLKIEDAALESLVLTQCKPVQFALTSPETQLEKLRSLSVRKCSESGRHLIQDISHMSSLQTLRYGEFPAACMPSSFPQGLQDVSLNPLDWCLNLPEGLQELCELREFVFDTSRRPWEFTVPLARLLPVQTLEKVAVGQHRYNLRDEAKWKEMEEDTLGVIKDHAPWYLAHW